MKTKTKIGAALLMLAYWLLRLSRALEDAGAEYERVAPPYIAKARKWGRMAWEWLSVHAWAAAVLVACCLAASFRGCCLLGSAVKRKAPAVLRKCIDSAQSVHKKCIESAQKVHRECIKSAAAVREKCGKSAVVVLRSGKECAQAARQVCIMAAPLLASLARMVCKAWEFRAELAAEGREGATC